MHSSNKTKIKLIKIKIKLQGRNYMKKILIIAFVLISIIGAYGQAMAFDINEVNLYKKSDCGNL